MNKTATTMERIIAKIDNDFNPDNSDWIPRVAAWTIDAMAILKVMQEETKTKKVKVTEKIAYDKCGFDTNIVKITDKYGCEIKEKGEKGCCDGIPFTGGLSESDMISTNGTIGVIVGGDKPQDVNIDTEITKNSSVPKWISHSVQYNENGGERNYVKIGKDKIELNFDTDYIIVTYKSIKTEYSSIYGCEVPVIPNNGILIECIAAWCIYKMLCRGYKHPVFNLRDNSPALNPFIFWIQNKDKAKDSVNIDSQGDIDSNLWRSSFYIDTFNPRR